jgi:hypothetical protein
VVSATFSDAVDPHTITLHFDDAIAGVPSPDWFILTNQTTGQVIDPASMTVAYDASTNTMKVIATNLPGGMLPDGSYSLQVDASRVRDASGNPLDGDGDGTGGDNFSFGFFHLTGDANHDGVTDFGDMVPMAQNYNGAAGMNYDQGDLNYDGVVDFNDLVILAQHYNTDLTTIAPPTAPAGSAVAVAAAAPATSAPATATAARPKAVSRPHASKPTAVDAPRFLHDASVFHTRRIVIGVRHRR